MTRSLIRSDLEEIEDFFNEFANTQGLDADPIDRDASIDLLIRQLEASAQTVSDLMAPASAPADDLPAQVQALAQRLERIALELAEINDKINRRE